MAKTIPCPDCKEEVAIPEDCEVGEVLECKNCGAEMEVLNLEPFQVSLIEEEK